jgi:proton glutamate symport protein
MSQPVRIIIALIAGLLAGLAVVDWSHVDAAVAIAEPIGNLWLTGLQMTIVPLVVALLVTGIAEGAEAARASRVAGRAILFFLAFLWLSTAITALIFPLLVNAIPLPQESADALRGTFQGAAPVTDAPSFADFLKSILPNNPVTAAANNAILPLILFTLVFAFAVTRLPLERREVITRFFRAIADAMLVMVNWVLWLAPAGVLALAFTVGARAGAAAFGALIHYVVVVSAVGLMVWIIAVPIGVIGGRIRLPVFLRGMAPSQAVAISTQSSLASLPAMLRGAEAMKVPVGASGVILPLAVAMFRGTSAGMNLAVALYVAWLLGIELSPWTVMAGWAVAATTTLGSVSLPGQVSFITSISPICAVMGVPVAPLGLLVAVEFFPDLFRTLGNVTMDLAATATVARRSGLMDVDEGTSEEDRLLSEPAG